MAFETHISVVSLEPDRLHVPLVSEARGAHQVKGVQGSEHKYAHYRGQSDDEWVVENLLQRRGDRGGREGCWSEPQVEVKVQRIKQSQKSVWELA